MTLATYRVPADSSDDAFAIIEGRAGAIDDPDRDGYGRQAIARRIAQRSYAEELNLPLGFHADDFIHWVGLNLESDEGVLDEETPEPLRKLVRRAVELINEPLYPGVCVRIGASREVARRNRDERASAVDSIYVFLERG